MKRLILLLPILCCANIYILAQANCASLLKEAKDKAIQDGCNLITGKATNANGLVNIINKLAFSCPEVMKEYNKWLEQSYQAELEKYCGYKDEPPPSSSSSCSISNSQVSGAGKAQPIAYSGNNNNKDNVNIIDRNQLSKAIDDLDIDKDNILDELDKPDTDLDAFCKALAAYRDGELYDEYTKHFEQYDKFVNNQKLRRDIEQMKNDLIDDSKWNNTIQGMGIVLHSTKTICDAIIEDVMNLLPVPTPFKILLQRGYSVTNATIRIANTLKEEQDLAIIEAVINENKGLIGEGLGKYKSETIEKIEAVHSIAKKGIELTNTLAAENNEWKTIRNNLLTSIQRFETQIKALDTKIEEYKKQNYKLNSTLEKVNEVLNSNCKKTPYRKP